MYDDQDWPKLRARALGQLPYDHPTHDKDRSLYGFERDVEFCRLMYELHVVEVSIMCNAKAKA